MDIRWSSRCADKREYVPQMSKCAVHCAQANCTPVLFIIIFFLSLFPHFFICKAD